jgi:hypothetical protein
MCLQVVHVIVDRWRIKSLYSLYANRTWNCTRNCTQNCTRVDCLLHATWTLQINYGRQPSSRLTFLECMSRRSGEMNECGCSLGEWKLYSYGLTVRAASRMQRACRFTAFLVSCRIKWPETSLVFCLVCH